MFSARSLKTIKTNHPKVVKIDAKPIPKSQHKLTKDDEHSIANRPSERQGPISALRLVLNVTV